MKRIFREGAWYVPLADYEAAIVVATAIGRQEVAAQLGAYQLQVELAHQELERLKRAIGRMCKPWIALAALAEMDDE